MSLREEDRQNKSSTSRGLGLAAAAIGVGVGAALYYFFSKRPENPDGAGSTSNWECERAQALGEDEFEDDTRRDLSSDSYTTLSEHTTTDTTIRTTPGDRNRNCYNIKETTRYTSEEEDCYTDDESETDDSTHSSATDSDVNTESDSSSTDNRYFDDEPAISDDGVSDDASDDLMNDSDLNNDWDVTQSSSGVPDEADDYLRRLRQCIVLDNFQGFLSSFISERGRVSTDEEQMERARALSEEEQIKFLRDQAFRERSWSLEECSICFEVILRDQEVMSLPCAHHFHTACILPWLQEQQTCPNCRKAAE